MEVRITREQMLKARTYLPLVEKNALLERADRCFDRLAIKSEGEPMPPMWKENSGLRARYLMVALASYFPLPFRHEGDDPLLMTAEDFDRFGESHLLMQIERFKKDEATRDKAYDLLFDYRSLERCFDREIRALLDVQNDAVIRQAQMTWTALGELPGLMEQLRAMQEGKKEAGENGA